MKICSVEYRSFQISPRGPYWAWQHGPCYVFWEHARNISLADVQEWSLELLSTLVMCFNTTELTRFCVISTTSWLGGNASFYECQVYGCDVGTVICIQVSKASWFVLPQIHEETNIIYICGAVIKRWAVFLQDRSIICVKYEFLKNPFYSCNMHGYSLEGVTAVWSKIKWWSRSDYSNQPQEVSQFCWFWCVVLI